MTGSEKLTWGIVLNSIGGLLLVGGIVLSFTFIGACLGVPMALVGLPVAIWGTVWMVQGKAEKQAETIADGIRAGLESAATVTGELALAIRTEDSEIEEPSPDSDEEEPSLPENDLGDDLSLEQGWEETNVEVDPATDELKP